MCYYWVESRTWFIKISSVLISLVCSKNKQYSWSMFQYLLQDSVLLHDENLCLKGYSSAFLALPWDGAHCHS